MTMVSLTWWVMSLWWKISSSDEGYSLTFWKWYKVSPGENDGKYHMVKMMSSLTWWGWWKVSPGEADGKSHRVKMMASLTWWKWWQVSPGEDDGNDPEQKTGRGCSVASAEIRRSERPANGVVALDGNGENCEHGGVLHQKLREGNYLA